MQIQRIIILIHRDGETGVTLLSTCYAMNNLFQTLLFLIYAGRFDFFFLSIRMYVFYTVPESALHPASRIN